MSGLKRTFSIMDQQGPKKKRKQYKQTKLTNQTLLTRLINNRAEKKQLDTVVVDTSTFVSNASNTYVACLNQTAEGDDSVNRTGRSINHSYLEIDFSMYASATMLSALAGQQSSFLGRIAIILDKQPNQALASYASIYEVVSSLNGSALRNVQTYPDRFQVLNTEIIQFSTSQGSFKKKIFINLANRLKGKDQEAKYAATAAAVPGTGAILIAVANDATNVTAGLGNYTMQYFARYRFTDL